MQLRSAIIASLFAVASLSATAPVSAEDGRALATRADDPNIQWAPCPPFFAETCRLGVLHGTPDQPNSDVFFRVAPGEVLPHHWHSSAERMVLVQGRLEVQYDGQEAVLLDAGMYAYGPPKLPHVGQCVSDEHCVLFIAFEGPIDAHPVE